MTPNTMATGRGIETTADLLRHYAEVRARLMRYDVPKPVLMLAPPPKPVKAQVFPIIAGCPLNMLAPPSWRFLVAIAAHRGGVSPQDIVGPIRTRQVASARHEAAYLMHTHLGWSLPRIGSKLGRRDHTTVLHSIVVQRKKLEVA